MLKLAAVVLSLLAASPAVSAQSSSPEAARSTAVLTIDTPVRELIADPRTRPVIVKHMPGFVDRLETDPEANQMFGGSTLRDMTADPHARGMTPEVLAKLGAELAEAQKPS